MNETPILDDFERAIAHTLHAKADQLDVDDEASFDPELATPVPLSLVRESASPPRARRRILAVAAAVAVLAGGATAIRTLGPGSDGDAPPLATGDITWNSPPEGTAALVPSWVPDGWVLSSVNVSRHRDVATTWQLFAVDGPSPLTRGVLVGSAAESSRSVPDGPTHTVQGRPAVMQQSNHPNVPADALEIDWDGGEAFHDVIAVGLTEAELLDFLDSLVPRDDAETGFDPPAGSPLPELDAVTTAEDLVVSRFRYASPDGTSELQVTAASSDFGGGLLHRLAGQDRLGGRAIAGGQGTWRFVSLARPDGWTVDVGTRSASLDPAVLDGVAESVQPVAEQQVVDMAAAAPVAATHTIDGWTVDIHGRDRAPIGFCLTPPGDAAVCGLASAYPPGTPTLTAGAVLVEDQWVLVVLTDGTQQVRVETSPSQFAGPEDDYDHRTLWDDDGSGEPAAALVPVPADVDAVMAGIVTDTGMTGFGFERP